MLAIGSCQLFPLKLPPLDASLARRRRHAIMLHTIRPAMIAKATPAAAPTPALKAIVCVTGVLEVWLAALADSVVVVEAELAVDALPAALGVVMLEDSELEVEV